MLHVGFTRIIRTAFNLSNCRNMSTKYIDCRCIYRLASTESTTKFDVDKQQNVSKTGINSILTFTNKLGLDANALTDPLKNILFTFDSDNLINNTTCLLNFGFNNNMILKFIEDQPSLFRMQPTQLDKLLITWQKLLLNEELAIELLSTHSQLIEMIGPLVTERIRFLLPYFQKMKIVAIALINTPSIIYENQGSLKAKLDFLHSHNIPMRKVASCSALELSLLEMKTRFAFLERAGVYKKLLDLYKKDLKIKNATVRNILCTDDKLFAEVIAKLTLIEYEAFIELFLLEQEFLDEELDDDDDSE